MTVQSVDGDVFNIGNPICINEYYISSIESSILTKGSSIFNEGSSILNIVNSILHIRSSIFLGLP